MKRNMTLILIALVTIAIISLVYYGSGEPTYDYSPVIKAIEVPLYEANKSVFIIEKVWGINSEHREIIISEQAPINGAIVDVAYIYRGQLSFLYKLESDTLVVYLRNEMEKKLPYGDQVKVTQVILDNPSMMKLLETYDEEGLEKL